MERKGNIVAVIVARGGSKSVPKKNIKLLAGKPLIAYTIEAALKSRFLDRVIVSTDDDEIAEISKKYGAEVPFKRPAELATDTAHTPEVIEHAVSWLEKNENYPVFAVVTLQPTSPLRKTRHIDEGIKKFLEGNHNSLISIKEAFSPYWMFKTEGNRAIPFVDYEKELGKVNPLELERQQLPRVYRVEGTLYITKRDYLKKEMSRFDLKNCGYILLDEKESLDIDTEIDFKLAEEVLKKNAKK